MELSVPQHLSPTVPALFAGNAVIAKTSEWTAWSAADFQAIFDEVLTKAGYSPDLVQVITGDGDGSRAGQLGCREDLLYRLAGKRSWQMAAAAQTLTPVVLELGGKDPMIICDDADLNQAVGSAMLGVFTACGQMCVAAERLYVFDGIYDRFVDEVRRAKSLRQGPPSQDAGGQFDVGALTMPRQLEIIDRQIQDAGEKGARRCSSVDDAIQAWPGSSLSRPSSSTDDHTMDLVKQETFGR